MRLGPVLHREGAFGGAGKRLGLGWDVAGTVDATGVATAWGVGDEVVALDHGMVKPLGTHAEYVVVDAGAVAVAPRATAAAHAAHAATLPLNGLTAAQALDLLDLAPGASLLVTGAAGAVGGYAVQLAAHRGLAVTALARAGDAELVRSLGARHLVTDLAEVPGGAVSGGGVDAVLDAAVLGEPALAWVRDGGAYAGVVPQSGPDPVRGIRVAAVEVAADGARLAELVRLVDEGVLTLRVAETYALDDAAKAHARLAAGGVRGRLVLVPGAGS
ncbi:zinc-binding dehydrogenase [Streptomyces sp. NPDC003717]|uniref:zinc-binding dehydrogenase n=1 Tax=Streptomyces sp. NPDC003717 TaxID=3154276 RepID=UPI0033A45EC6